MSDSELIHIAREAREKAHAPYSKFKVGAALRTKSGRIFRGCNVENISYRLTCCAEQSAVCAAVAEGEQEFVEIAVVTDSDKPAVPCGACRQTMAEFNPSLRIIMSTMDGQVEVNSLSNMLPEPSRGILDKHV